MLKSTRRIVALDPGTKKTGFAVFEGQRLVHHGVKVFASPSAPRDTLRETRRFIASLIDTYRPNVLAVERLYFMKRTARMALLNQYYRQILYTGRARRLTVLAYAPSAVKKHVTGFGWADKELVARMVVKRYPELRAYLVQDRRWQRLHHANMFDAVAVGMLALDSL